jgi:hypothetical protein
VWWTFRHVRRRHPYLYADLALQTVLPVCLLAALAGILLRARHDWTVLAAYLAVIAVVGVLRSIYGLASTRRPGFLLFAVYGYLNLFLLIPTRIYALCTLGRTHWGTRGMTSA